ncbi:Uncharacterised protein [Mycobacteroides abscessus subsp. abscessus]|nr:Uncharacterised protein [Mycobacteroides abscessus subsp. abscessus]
MYQERSISTISPPLGRWAVYRWKYHCVCSTAVGFSNATTRAPRGLRCSVNRLIDPPLPAASRPSKMMHIFSPCSLTHSCSFNNSICSLRLVFSYSLRVSFSS